MLLDKQLKTLLKEHQTTVASLARATKVPNKALYRWLEGQAPRNFNQVKKVADHFEVTLDFLVFGISPPPAAPMRLENLKEEIAFGRFDVILRPIKQ